MRIIHQINLYSREQIMNFPKVVHRKARDATGSLQPNG